MGLYDKRIGKQPTRCKHCGERLYKDGNKWVGSTGHTVCDARYKDKSSSGKHEPYRG